MKLKHTWKIVLACGFIAVVGIALAGCIKHHPVKADQRGGTVTVIDKQNGTDNTYYNAKISTLYQFGTNGSTDDEMVIITQDGTRIRPSHDAQVTYTKDAVDDGINLHD